MQTYLIRQKIQPLVNQYAIYEAGADGQQGQMVGFAQQKRFAFKEKFTIYTDDSKSAVAFDIQARQVIDLGARYDVRDADGTVIGTIGKDFKSSLLRSTWHIFRPGQEDKPALIAHERTQGLAILRRIWDFLPFVGDVPFLIKYHFDFIDPADGRVVATYNKTSLLFDYYQLELQDEADSIADWRVYVAMGILLDALQSR